MKNLKRALVFLLVLIISFSMASVVAFADTIELDADQKAYLEAHCEDVLYHSYITTDPSRTNDTSKFITLNNQSYYLTKNTSESTFVQLVKSNYEGSKATDKVNNITDGLSPEADTQGAVEVLSGFVPVLNLVLGIITTLITLGLAVFTSFDIVYITFPVFREKCENQKMAGSGALVSKTASGESKLRWVSDEAQFAVKNASLEQGQNPLVSYFKNRVVTYIVVAVILFILLTGNIQIITNIVLKLVSGIMNIANTLA